MPTVVTLVAGASKAGWPGKVLERNGLMRPRFAHVPVWAPNLSALKTAPIVETGIDG